jgi:hypothetical protein
MNWPPLGALRHRQHAPDPRDAGLGPDHPIVQATEAVRYTGRQWLHVAAVLTGGAIARLEGHAWALSLTCAAATVLAILSVLLGAHHRCERDCAIAVILDGGERVAIGAVQRERRRLLSDRTRHGLARTIERILRQARDRRLLRFTPIPFDAVVVTTVADELVDVVARLKSPGVSAREVALADRLIRYALSPLYGRDVDALREQLRRLRDPPPNRGA